MKSTTKKKGVPAPPRGPLSVAIPQDLLARLKAEAKRRNLKLATTARQLLDERVRELEDSTELSRAEEWQRAQAWATWEKVKAGDLRSTSMESLRGRGRVTDTTAAPPTDRQ